MSGRRLLRSAQLLALLSALALAGCGGGKEEPDPPLTGARLTVYGSLPLHGPLGAVAADVRDAQRLALERDGGRVGRYAIRFVPLDASDPEQGGADPSRVSENARRAARDPGAVAYLGELATGSSAISIPLLNEAGILQVSPLDTAMTLTSGSIAVAGSPRRFYPRLEEVGRTFARVAPSDRTQAAALLAYMRQEGVGRLALLTDEDPSGRALAARVRATARDAGVTVVAREEIDVHAREHDEAVERVVEARPDAVLDATGARPGAARLWRELAAAGPALQLYAPASLADPAFVAALGPAAAAAHVTRPVLDGRVEPRAARRFEHAFERRFGRAPAAEARYGYEAMRAVLAAIRRAERRVPDGLLTRAAVVRALFAARPRDGVLGAYAIDPQGDTSLARWGAFRVAGAELRYVRPLDGGPAASAGATGGTRGAATSVAAER